MRSTTFTSVIAGSLAGAAMAQSVPIGCFTRQYDAAHLAAHPAQVVSAMWLRIEDVGDGAASFSLTARMAAQGHAGKEGLAGQRLSEGGMCMQGARCNVDCDGGGFTVTRQQGDSIDITTDRMRVTRQGCGGDMEDIHSNLAEVSGQPTTYRLFRANDAACNIE